MDFSFYQHYLLIVATKCLECRKGDWCYIYLVFLKRKGYDSHVFWHVHFNPSSYSNSFLKYWSKNWNRLKFNFYQPLMYDIYHDTVILFFSKNLIVANVRKKVKSACCILLLELAKAKALHRRGRRFPVIGRRLAREERSIERCPRCPKLGYRETDLPLANPINLRAVRKTVSILACV